MSILGFGCVRLGIAAETLDQARQTTASDALTVVQLPFGVLDPQAGDALIPYMHESGRQVIVRDVLGAGLLGGPPLAGEPKAEFIADVRHLADEVGVNAMQLALWLSARGRISMSCSRVRVHVATSANSLAGSTHRRPVPTYWTRSTRSSTEIGRRAVPTEHTAATTTSCDE